MSNVPMIPVDQIQTMAVSIAKSNLFGVKTPDQALALMLIAQAEGMHPAIAARDFHIINGRPALKADAMLARFQTAGGKVEWKIYTDEKVTAVVSHPQGGSVEISWTIDMANKAGLTKNPTWKQYPRQMLRARVISEGIRTVFPGVAVGVYTPEEVEDFAPPKTRNMGPAEVIIEEAPAQSGKLPDVLKSIAAAQTDSELDAIRPAIKQLTEHERGIAVQAGINRRNALKAATIDVDTDALFDQGGDDAAPDND